MGNHERQNLGSPLRAAAFGGLVGGVAVAPSPDACALAPYAAGGIVCGAIAGTIAAAAVTFVVPPSWQRIAGSIAGFVVGLAAAAGAAVAAALLSNQS
jgi:hypothetical protein